MLSSKERRRFIRHPICYPLEFEYAPKKGTRRTRTINISEGGLLFLSKRQAKAGEEVILKLPVQNRIFRVKARVMHTRQDVENPKLYNVGVSFFQHSAAFRVKLIEQLYLIDEYRSLCALQRNRDVSFKEASEEWIKRYSKRFDEMFWGNDRGNGDLPQEQGPGK